MSRFERQAWYAVALSGLTLVALTHWIPLLFAEGHSLTFYDSALVPLLLLALGISRPAQKAHQRAALLLVVFPLTALVPLLLGHEDNRIWSQSVWPSLSTAIAFAFYLTVAGPFAASAPAYVATDTRGLERFELGLHARHTRRPQRVYLALSFLFTWCLAVPAALSFGEAELTTLWGDLATEVRVFTQVLALALAAFVLIVFVAPSTRTKPPSRRNLRVRVLRSLAFAAAALGALLFWSLR